MNPKGAFRLNRGSIDREVQGTALIDRRLSAIGPDYSGKAPYMSEPRHAAPWTSRRHAAQTRQATPLHRRDGYYRLREAAEGVARC